MDYSQVKGQKGQNEMRAHLNQSETVRRAITLLHFVVILLHRVGKIKKSN